MHILEVDGVTHLLRLCLACDDDPIPTSPKPVHDESHIKCTVHSGKTSIALPLNSHSYRKVVSTWDSIA